jgi:hypothetical protein
MNQNQSKKNEMIMLKSWAPSLSCRGSTPFQVGDVEMFNHWGLTTWAPAMIEECGIALVQ